MLRDPVSRVHLGVRSGHPPVHEILAPDYEHEQDAEHDVAKVGEDVVEVGQLTELVRAQEVVVAEVLVASGVQDVLK